MLLAEDLPLYCKRALPLLIAAIGIGASLSDLSAQDLTDLVHYLSSLKDNAKP